MNGPPPGDTSKERLESSAFGAVLFALALVPRLFVALRWSGEPVWDGHYYDFGARRIAAGLGYSDDILVNGTPRWHAWCHYPVGYSAFMAFFYRVFGEGPRVVALVDASTGAALAWVTWQLARRGLSETRARIAGLVVALHPGLILYAGLEMSEPLAAVTTLLAFWFAVRDDKPVRGVVAGSVVLGLSALVRPQALLSAPFLALAVPPRRGVIVRLAVAVLACGVALAPVLPWTARNCRVMDGCALVSTNAGWNLAIGAFPRATGRFETLKASDGCQDVTGQVQQDRCWFDYGVAQIRDRPLRWLGLIPAKLGYTFDHESFAVEYLHEARPAAWPEGRRTLYRAAITTVHRILIMFGAFGVCVVRLRGRGGVAQGLVLVTACTLSYLACTGTPALWPLVLFASTVPWLPLPGRAAWPAALELPVAFLGTTALTHAVFFGEDRYHLVVTPVLAILAAAAFRAPEASSRGGVEDPRMGRPTRKVLLDAAESPHEVAIAN